MHRSRLAGLIIDCKTGNLDAAAEFWGSALGAPPARSANLANDPYVDLQAPDRDVYLSVQAVDHESRVHIDIESDDIEAEVARLVKLGATRLADIKDWVVMLSPTGQQFCVVPVVRGGFDENANRWD